MNENVRFRWQWLRLVAGMYLILAVLGGWESLRMMAIFYVIWVGVAYLEYKGRRRRLHLYADTVPQWQKLIDIGRTLPDREWVTFDNVVQSCDRTVEARNYQVPHRHTQFNVFDSEDDYDSSHRSVIHRSYRVAWDDPLIDTSTGGYAVDKHTDIVIHSERRPWWAWVRGRFSKAARIAHATGPSAAELNDLLDWFQHADRRQTTRGGTHD